MTSQACPACNAPRSPATRFCGQCGASLPLVCPSCQFENPPAHAFCGRCGHALTGERSETAPGPAAERRRITVLFCDLVGSTDLSSRLDPEELRTVILRYQQAAAGVIEQFGGHVAQYLGDGVMAYFGYPKAHEDDPVRSVHAGLGIVQEIRALPPTPGTTPLAVRIGIDTGLVVAGDVGGGQRREQLAVGQTPNVAARLQAEAEPNSVLVSDDLVALCEGYFQFEPKGERDLKGLGAPTPVFRPIRATSVRTRFDLSRRRGLARLVGREAEIALLQQRFQAAESGRARSVLVVAEAGLGKSRLVEELRDRTGDRPRRWLTLAGSDYHRDSPFYPVADLLHQLIRSGEHQPTGQRLERLQALASELPSDAADAVALLAPLIGLEPGAGFEPSAASPQRQKEQTLELLAAAVLRETESATVVLAAEDLHWLDPSTLDLLGLLIQRAGSARLLVVMTARPGFTPPWESRTRLSQITLDPLDREDASTLIANLASGRLLDPSTAQALIDRSDGVPLFVEELTRAVLSADRAATTTSASIPASLEDSLRARLDQLTGANEVVRPAAAIGREFAFDLLLAVTGLVETTLRDRLDRLVDAEILEVRGIWPRVSYLFRHALIHEAAYGSLLSSKRAELHRRVADELTGRFAELAEASPEVTARHLMQAGERARALELWERAAGKAAARYANAEAAGLYRQALDCLDALEDGPVRQRRELALLTALAPALVVTQGYGAEEVARTYDRAHALCQALGGAQQLFGTLWGLAAFYQAHGPIARLLEIARQMADEADRVGGVELMMESRFALGAAQLMGGDYPGAAAALEEAIAPCRADVALAEATSGAGSVRGTNLLSNLAVVRTSQGEVEAGRRLSEESVTLARRMKNPSNLAAGLIYEAWRAQLAGDVAATRRAAEEALGLSAEFPFWAAWGTALRGWADARSGRADEGLAALRGSIAALEQAGVRTVSPSLLAAEADALLADGRIEAGLEAAAGGLEAARVSGSHGWDAELLRLRGELELTQPGGEARGRATLAEAVRAAKERGALLTVERAERRLSGTPDR